VVGWISPVAVWKRPTTAKSWSSRDDEVVGEALGCARGWDAVFCIRGDVVMLVSKLNLTLGF
jgi:hypothetical protein